jgi:hypothetical protein
VILKPSHGAKILRKTGKGGFSPQAEYIFRKQLEEADFLVINRIDELPPTEVNELSQLLEEQFPGRPQLRLSAKTGAGFAAFCDYLDQQGIFGQRRMEVDYEIYAEGEAELGWLNCQLFLDGRTPFELDRCLIELITGMRDRFAAIPAETAHVKAIGIWDGYYGVANLVSSLSEPTLSLASRSRITKANVVINARVALEPETLKSCIEATVETVAQQHGLTFRIEALQSFRPGRPVPTHRILEEIA